MQLVRNWILIALSTLFLIACSATGSPDKVAEAFIKAAAKGDVEKVMQLIDIPNANQNELQMIKGKVTMIVAEGSAKFEAQGGLKSVKTLSTEYSENKTTAVVRVEVTMNNKQVDTDNVRTIKTDDGWKVKL